MTRPGVLTGTLVGGMLTTPLVALHFVGAQLAGLPFPPFDVFALITRLLPGPLITFGIDTMVALIGALSLGETSTVAKLAEQAMAIVGLVATGAVAGGAWFGVVRHREATVGPRAGLVIGAIVGLPIMFISTDVSQTATAPAAIGAIWIVGSFLAWGVALAWSHERLMAAPDAADATIRVARLNRRQFIIRLGGATAVMTVAGAGVSTVLARGRRAAVAIDPSLLWSTNNPLPNAEAAVQPARGTRPEFTSLDDHYRIDISPMPPAVEGARWRLGVGGLVEVPLELSLEELRTRYEPLHQFVTLACISNPIGGSLTSTTRWTGVSLRRVLEDVRVRPNATHLKIRSADGFDEIVALELVRADARVMLAYAWDGVPLEPKHGFPLRIYIPDHYGMKQPKWIESIEAIDQWEPGYWVRRGWDRVARMRATAVIDTVAADMMSVQAGQAITVPIGGIAHAGARGISRVEVRVDTGPWVEAALRAPLSATTWVIWRYDWPFQEGDHTVTVRCVEGNGTPQIETRAPVRPSGATGLHTEQVLL